MIKADLIHDMQCDRCLRPAVIYQRYSGLHLCEQHLIVDVTAKAKRVVRAYAGLRPGDRIAVICTGRKSGYAILSFMDSLLTGRRDITLFCIAYIHDQNQMADALRLSMELGIDCTQIAATEEGHLLTLGEFHDSRIMEPLIHAARKLGITKFVLDRTLDDTALFILTKLLDGGIPGNEKEAICGQQAITPFMHIPARETDLYLDMLHPDIGGIPSGGNSRDGRGQGLRADVKILLDDYSTRHPSTKFALVNLGEALWNPESAMNIQADSSKEGTQ